MAWLFSAVLLRVVQCAPSRAHFNVKMDRPIFSYVQNTEGAIGEFATRAADRSASCILIVPAFVSGRSDTATGRAVAALSPSAHVSRIERKRVGDCAIFILEATSGAKMMRAVARVFDGISKRRLRDKFVEGLSACADAVGSGPVVCNPPVILFEDADGADWQMLLSSVKRRVHFVIVSKSLPRSSCSIAPISRSSPVASTSASTSASASASDDTFL